MIIRSAVYGSRDVRPLEEFLDPRAPIFSSNTEHRFSANRIFLLRSRMDRGEGESVSSQSQANTLDNESKRSAADRISPAAMVSTECPVISRPTRDRWTPENVTLCHARRKNLRRRASERSRPGPRCRAGSSNVHCALTRWLTKESTAIDDTTTPLCYQIARAG